MAWRRSIIRHHRANQSIFLYAFDLIELNGDDLRRDPLEVRKATLASIAAKASPGIRFNEHIEGDGPTVFAHACGHAGAHRGRLFHPWFFWSPCIFFWTTSEV